MWSSIIASLVDKFIMKAWDAISSWWLSKKKIEKAVKIIDEEEKAVQDAIKIIKDKLINGEELTQDDVKKLKLASRKLNSGFFN